MAKRVCSTGKTGYTEKKEVENIVDQMNNRENCIFEYTPYNCQNCGNWHIKRVFKE